MPLRAVMPIVVVAVMAWALLPAPADAKRPPRLALAACTGPGMEAFRCGSLTVPENPDAPDARTITLNVLVLPAREPAPGRVPLYSLAGGPGLPATDDVMFFATEGRQNWQHRDVVLVDQRGTGRSSPLRCPALESRHALQTMYPPALVRACRESLAAAHDLDRYGTADAVRDLEAVRQALGHERIDLVGLSYGTRLAQAYAHRHPQQVRAMALLGAVPDGRRIPLDHAANGQAVLDAVFADCAADAACAAAYPDLPGKLSSVLGRLEREPVTVEFARGDQRETITIERGPFGEALRSLLLSTPGQRALPSLVQAMAAGDFQPFLAAVLGNGGVPSGAEGLYLSLTCGEDTDRIAPEEIDAATAGTFLGRYRIDEQRTACREWRAAAPAPRPDGAMPDVPVLLLAGDRDYVTPRAWADEVAARFPRARVVPIAKLGHFPIGLDGMACYDELIDAFFQAGRADTLDVACVARMTPPPFVLPKAK
jgi:pimeloyl-ACP methyl ester carboxylesterase